MRRTWDIFGGVLLAVTLFFSGCSGGGVATTSGPPSQIVLANFVSGLNQPVDLQAPNDGSGRLFAVEQAGQIRIIQNGTLSSSAFLDIRSRVLFPGPDTEEGLLGLAFHPTYISNGRFFVNYVRSGGPTGQQTIIAEYHVTANPNTADPLSERILLVVDQPFSNHKGGQLVFGNDGKLYIGLGDGGSEGDPLGNGQNTNTLLGKMLRLDVDSTPSPGKQYAIPPDNPFVSGGGLPEIWAYGLRNPWRFAFDHPTGRLFCADVGQDHFEEVDLITKGGNFGWNVMEGNHCFNPITNCNMAGLILPIVEYSHSEGSAIVGGYLYRGSALPSLAGTYIFGDLSGGKVWGLQEDSMGHWQRTILVTHSLTVSSFGQDQAGELYLLDYGNGAILRLRAA